MIKAEIANNRALGQFGDRWVAMPLPSMSEPSKAVCWLTEHADFRKPDGTPDDDHVAWLHNKASLHAVDTYFMNAHKSANATLIGQLLNSNESKLHIRRTRIRAILSALPSWPDFESACKAVYCII